MNPDRYEITLLAPGMPFQGDTLQTKSLGGSETAALCVARELKKLGHRVTVFSNCETPGVYDGVVYRHVNEFGAYSVMAPHDICIVQRAPEAFSRRLNSRLNVLWCHDLAIRRQEAPFKGVLWNVDRVMVVSRYMADQYKEVYGVPEEVLAVTRNGIETDRFKRVASSEVPLPGAEFPTGFFPPRDRKKLMYCARPERGLDVLLRDIFPKLLQRDPELRLFVAGYDNTVPQMVDFYAHIGQLMAKFGDRVVQLGFLTKDELYRHYLAAGVYVYPTPSPTMPMFAEVSCISAMECQAAGVPIVTSNRGALAETIAKGAGTLIDGEPTSAEYQDAFVNAVMRYMRDDVAWNRASSTGEMHAKTLDWAGVAEEWTEMFGQVLAQANDSPLRLVRHFIRRSDIVAARARLVGVDGDEADELRARIGRDWSFVDGGPSAQAAQSETPEQVQLRFHKGLREQCEKIGQTHTDVFDQASTEPRFQMFEEWFKAHPDVRRILDFGCAHGAYTVNMANRVGRTWVGVDIDKYGIAWAEKFRTTRANDAAAISFRVGDQTVDLSDQEPFDLLFIGETLEHVLDPTAFITDLERWVKPGGKVLVTVPYGPWEYLSYDTYPHRAHLWEYDAHDLHEIFGQKADFTITIMPFSMAQPLDEPLGFHIVEYTVQPGCPTGQIDMARKLRLQRPRQTVSLNMMAGPGAEEMLHWSLRSVKHLVDEVVLVDTGMTEEGRRIAAQYPVRIVSGSSPIEAGFETPRNEGLPHCRMDWVLWLDTDEKMLDVEKAHKYLRGNLFNGYSIRQHHFAVDTGFKPDMPVRLFRRGLCQGKAMRWFGMIHEHPELGINEGPGQTIILSDVHIAHVGYLIESTRRERFSRNYPLLQRDIERYPERLLQKHFVMRDNMLLVMYEIQQNGGRPTEDIRRRCRETVELYRKHFLGRGGYLNTDSIQYYSQALQVLGEGFEAAFQIAAGKDQANPDGVTRVRFATLEDMEKELAWRAREAAAPFADKWW